jgi:hypothetical protein
MRNLGAPLHRAQLAALALALSFGLCLSACSGSPAPASAPPQASPATELPPSHPPIADGQKLPPSHPPVATGTAAPSAPAPEGPATVGGLRWEHQAPLVRRAPKSSMRAAEYGIADDAKAELTVFYFGPDQGGSVDANVTRWLGQLTQPDGKDTASVAKRKKREVEGVSVTVVEATGRFAGGSMPGAPPSPEIPEALLLGAIAEGPQGPVFFKLIGPRAAVESARGAFDALIGSLRR